MGLKPKNTRRSIWALPQAATTIASAWTPVVDSATAVLPASVPKIVLHECTVCKNLVVTSNGLDMSFHAMNAASRSGCQSCSLVACVLREYELNLTTDDNVHLFVEGDGTLKLRFDSSSHEDTTEEIDLFIFESKSLYFESRSIVTKHNRQYLPMAVYKTETTRARDL